MKQTHIVDPSNVLKDKGLHIAPSTERLHFIYVLKDYVSYPVLKDYMSCRRTTFEYINVLKDYV